MIIDQSNINNTQNVDHADLLRIDMEKLEKNSDIMLFLNMCIPFVESNYKDQRFKYCMYKKSVIDDDMEIIEGKYNLLFQIKFKKRCMCSENIFITIYKYQSDTFETISKEFVNNFLDNIFKDIKQSKICQDCRSYTCSCQVHYLLFENDLELIDKCPICMEVIDNNKYYCCKNHHKIHLHCFSLHKLNDSCPVCKTNYRYLVFCNTCFLDREIV
jgi:hypothetical protein